jgi:bifunctional DNA-binding transcriptional regulator/antitoxin component of YhaV-PrlF toxin-antitoxin module
MQTSVSVRGQTVIPRAIRQAMGITSATRLQWAVRDGVIIVTPLPEDPVSASVGILKNRKVSSQELLVQRKRDREKEK